MKSSLIRSLGAVGLVALFGALAACNNQTPPTTTPPSTAPASTSPAASASPALEGADFVDNFDGTSVDATKWDAYQQSGLFLARDGRMEILNAGNQPNFPVLISKNVIIPQEGAYFFETNFQYLASGSPVSFNLDWEPPEAPGKEGLTIPFMRTIPVSTAMRMVFNLESGPKNVDTPLGVLDSRVNLAHTLRIEYDGNSQYKVIFDGEQKGTFESKRRPRKFWIGAYPNKDIAPTAWPRIALDYVKAGVLAPGAAATPTPAPTASPSPAATASTAP